MKSVNGTYYALAHWCNQSNKWVVATAHKFLLALSEKSLIGQYVTSSWFDCPVQTNKTFLIIGVSDKLPIVEIETYLQKKIGNKYIKSIETFILPNLEDIYKKLEEETSVAVRIHGIHTANILRMTIFKSSDHKDQFFCTLPSFEFPRTILKI